MDKFPVLNLADAAKFDQSIIVSVTGKIYLHLPEYNTTLLASTTGEITNGDTVAFAGNNGLAIVGICKISDTEIIIKDLYSSRILHVNRQNTKQTAKWIFPVINMRIFCLRNNRNRETTLPK